MPKTEAKREPRPKKKKNESLELLRAITKSMAGAVPGISQETRDLIDDSLARPISGMASQIVAEDPTEPGKLVFPPLQNMKRAWNADSRRKSGQEPAKMAMPGLVQDTLSLPSMFGGGPQWAQDASASADRIHSAVDEGMDLAPPEGFRQHALNSAGMMAAQIPVAGKAKEVPEIAKGALQIAKKYGKKALASPFEFFLPTIEPKMSNYLFGSVAGGGLGTLGDDAEEVAEEVPLPRAVSRAKGGKVGALSQILRSVSMNPDATVKQKQHVIGDPVEEVLHAANEGERKGVIDSAEGQRIRTLMESGDEDSLADALMNLQRKLFPSSPMAPIGRQVVTSAAAPQGLGKLPEVESNVPLLGPAPHVTEVPDVPVRVRPAEAPAGHGTRDFGEWEKDDLDQTNRMQNLIDQRIDDGSEILTVPKLLQNNRQLVQQGTVQVLKNPSQEEVLRFAGREIPRVRMMTDREGNTYVWDADAAIHDWVLRGLGIDRQDLWNEMSDTPIRPRDYYRWLYTSPTE